MNTLIQANIFFFITSVVTIVLAIGAAVLLFYIIKVARNVDYISEKIREESDNVSQDIEALRSRIREEGLRVAPFIGIISKLFGARKGPPPPPRPGHGPRRKTPKNEPSKEHEQSEN